MQWNQHKINQLYTNAMKNSRNESKQNQNNRKEKNRKQTPWPKTLTSRPSSPRPSPQPCPRWMVAPIDRIHFCSPLPLEPTGQGCHPPLVTNKTKVVMQAPAVAARLYYASLAPGGRLCLHI